MDGVVLRLVWVQDPGGEGEGDCVCVHASLSALGCCGWCCCKASSVVMIPLGNPHQEDGSTNC